MKKTVEEAIKELKDISSQIETNPKVAEELEKAESAPKGKDLDSEEGGSDPKIKESKVLDAEENSQGKRRKDDIVPGAREIRHLQDNSPFAKDEKKASPEEARKVFDKYNAARQSEDEKALREKQAKERADKEIKKDEM